MPSSGETSVRVRCGSKKNHNNGIHSNRPGDITHNSIKNAKRKVPGTIYLMFFTVSTGNQVPRTRCLQSGTRYYKTHVFWSRFDFRPFCGRLVDDEPRVEPRDAEVHRDRQGLEKNSSS